MKKVDELFLCPPNEFYRTGEENAGGICEFCMYFPGMCQYGEIGQKVCKVNLIRECKEIIRIKKADGLYEDMMCLQDSSSTNRTARELFELMSKIRHNASLDLPGWFREK